MTKLSVNINKVATLRNARGGNNPNLLQVAIDCERFGAQGITVHPRPDERHIRYADVYALKEIVSTELNIEGYPSEDFCQLVEAVVPTQVTLVPDSPEQLTSNHGWDTIRCANALRSIVERFQKKGIRVSIFIDPHPLFAEGAKAVGADRVELYTEPYAAGFHADPKTAIAPFVATAKRCEELGLGLNAGHDLDLHNLAYLHDHIPNLAEVSIGHALICDALYLGLETTIQRYLDCL